MAPGAQSCVLLGLGASPGPSLSPAGCRGPQAQPPLRGTWRWGMPPPLPRRAPGAASGLRCPRSPGHPAARPPRRGTGVNRKPCAPAVARGRPGMCRWPPGCLFGVEAAGSCREEPGSTRPGIARELIATSRRSLPRPRGHPAPGPPRRAPSSQPYAPAGLGAHAGASPGVGGSLGSPNTGAAESRGEGQGCGQQRSP